MNSSLKENDDPSLSSPNKLKTQNPVSRVPFSNVINAVHLNQPQTVSSPKTFEKLSEKHAIEDWKERTEVVTKIDHMNNMKIAKDIVNELVEGAMDRSTGISQNTEQFREPANITVTNDSVAVELFLGVSIKVEETTEKTLNNDSIITENKEQCTNAVEDSTNTTISIVTTDSDDNTSGIIPKQAVYNLDFLDNLDDPNFNPFQTKTAVCNSPEKCTDLSESLKAETSECNTTDEMNNTVVLKDDLSRSATEDTPSVHNNTTSLKKTNQKAEPEGMNCTISLPKDEPEIKTTSSEKGKIGRKSLTSQEFDLIAQEAFKLVEIVTPKSQFTRPRCVFSPAVNSPVLQRSKAGEDADFKNATDFFNQVELDALSGHGTEGDRENLVRNSIFTKFDPLVAGRPSLAPYLHQEDPNDPRRESGLISFSPSPTKKTDATNTTELASTTMSLIDPNDTTINATLMDDALALGTTTQADATVLINSTMTRTSSMNSTTSVKSISETELKESFMKEMKEALKKQELVFQDQLLRNSCTMEVERKEYENRLSEQSVVIADLTEQNETMKSVMQQTQNLIKKMAEQKEAREDEYNNEMLDLINEHEKKLAYEVKKHEQVTDKLKKEVTVLQEEIKNCEASFFDTVKKLERVREVCQILKSNEESLKKAADAELKAKMALKEESVKVISELGEELEQMKTRLKEKENLESELNKANVLIKRAEIKILSQKQSLDQFEKENKHLMGLLDDVTQKLG